MANESFSNLFSASRTTNVEDVCTNIKRRLNTSQIGLLSQPFTLEEVDVALKQLVP